MRTHRLLIPLHGFVILFLVSAILGVQSSYNPALSAEVQIGIVLAIGLYFVLARMGCRAGWSPMASAIFCCLRVSPMPDSLSCNSPVWVQIVFIPRFSPFIGWKLKH